MGDNMRRAKELILARLLEDSDFPALVKTIQTINEFKVTEDTSVTDFANIVLKDYGLTTRVLRLVNSVSYAQFGEVTTVSRATVLLGIANIKNLALTLLLFVHLKKNSSNIEHMDTMLKSLYSGMLAQKISGDLNFAEKEEAYICSLFHNFGKMLVSFAFPSKVQEIKLTCREQGIPEDTAAPRVLGCRYEEIGMEIAKEWHFPEKIIRSMRKMYERDISGRSGEVDKLDGISFFANEVADILSNGSEKKEMDEKLGRLTRSFTRQFEGLHEDDMRDILHASVSELTEFANIYEIALDTLPFNQQLLTWTDMIGKTVQAAFDTALIKTIDMIFDSEKEDAAEGIFARGIQDINSAIFNKFSLNDIIRIVLETIYRGMQLSGEAKALFLLKDKKLPVMNVRFGFGSGIEELKQWFNVHLGDSRDIFNLAVLKQSDLVIGDIGPQEIRKLLPEWFKNRTVNNVFIVLLPIIVNSKPIGMFYIEGDSEGFGKISGSHLNYLKILRDQSVMAIRQKNW